MGRLSWNTPKTPSTVAKGEGMGLFDGVSARAVAGFACQQGFLYALFYLGSNRAVEIGGVSIERFDLMLTFVFMALSFAIVRVASLRARHALLAPTLVGWYAVLLVIGSLLVSLPIDAGIAEVAAEGALVGLPSGFLLCAWGRALVGCPRYSGSREVLLATAIGAAAGFAFAAIAVPGVAEMAKLLPIGSAWALRSLPPSPDSPEHRDGGGEPSLSLSELIASTEERAAAARLSVRVVAGTTLFGLAGGFMEVFSSEPGMAAVPTFPATLLILVLFCIAATQLLAALNSGSKKTLENGGSLAGAYRLALLLTMAGYLFVPVLGRFGVTGQSIALAGYLGLTCVLMMMFLAIARASGDDAAVSFARGFFALFIGEVVGIAFGNAIELLQPDSAQPYAVAACAGLASLFAYLFLFTENDFAELTTIAESIDAFDEACKRIVERSGLSKREAEVLPLALRGRTAERIAGELCIAKSTVDTHLRRIYAKVGVHSRQELIDLGERVQSDEERGR